MENKKRLIDANAYAYPGDLINEPTIDAVEVVRCEKCASHDTDTCPENRVWCKMLRRYMKPDGYCSFGVKGETNEKLV